MLIKICVKSADEAPPIHIFSIDISWQPEESDPGPFYFNMVYRDLKADNDNKLSIDLMHRLNVLIFLYECMAKSTTKLN